MGPTIVRTPYAFTARHLNVTRIPLGAEHKAKLKAHLEAVTTAALAMESMPVEIHTAFREVTPSPWSDSQAWEWDTTLVPEASDG